MKSCRIGENELVKDYRARGNKWLKAEVQKRVGKSMYLCKLQDGSIWKRHVDQLRKLKEVAKRYGRHGKEEDRRMVESKIVYNSNYDDSSNTIENHEQFNSNFTKNIREVSLDHENNFNVSGVANIFEDDFNKFCIEAQGSLCNDNLLISSEDEF
ncbi:unnamed protein product [Psylliodes chrysocephalus]|uniref:Uncharacterized protein n=1 Tax=Psylliodes chrysocephalus TaxID=3402493 RepID=A0A9P0CEI9_9CUCU|nr:unnamed protein product [Psylliodes chrysocephala]